MLGLVLGTLRLPLIVACGREPACGRGHEHRDLGCRGGSGRLAARAGGPRRLADRRLDGAAVGRRRRTRRARRRTTSRSGRSTPRSRSCSSGAPIDLAFRPVAPRPRERLRLSPAVACGLGIGVIGGAVGVILGTLRMPALVRAVGLDLRRAVGTNLVVGFAARPRRFRDARRRARRPLGHPGRGSRRRAAGSLARRACDREAERARSAGRAGRRRSASSASRSPPAPLF